MFVTAKDITGEVYTSPDVTKDELLAACAEEGMTEQEVMNAYKDMVEMLKDYSKLTYVTINLGTLTEPDYIDLNPSNLIYVRIGNKFEEWD